MRTVEILDNWNTFPPGELIKEEMDARGWDIFHMAGLLHMSTQQLQSIIDGKGKISIHTAKMIGAAFGTSADLWIRLEVEYRKKKDGAIGCAAVLITLILAFTAFSLLPVYFIHQQRMAQIQSGGVK